MRTCPIGRALSYGGGIRRRQPSRSTVDFSREAVLMLRRQRSKQLDLDSHAATLDLMAPSAAR
jgi:hypothetical protein